MPPLFFVNASASGDRLRYSLSHEMGHIVMHEVHTEDMEREANRFAAEFLMPANDIRSSLDGLSLPKLATLKPYWKVSMAALLKRATDLKKITERQVRYLWMQMGRLGYRTREPAELEIPVEKPTTLRELFDVYTDELNYSIADLSNLLDVFEHHVRADYFGKSGHLRVVKPQFQRSGVHTN